MVCYALFVLYCSILLFTIDPTCTILCHPTLPIYYEKVERGGIWSSSGSALVRVGVHLLRRAAVPSVVVGLSRAQTKKAVLTLLLIQCCVVLHEILHLGWFSTRHQFTSVFLLLVCQFLNFYSYIFIVTGQPGIIQKIVGLSLYSARSMSPMVTTWPSPKTNTSAVTSRSATSYPTEARSIDSNSA